MVHLGIVLLSTMLLNIGAAVPAVPNELVNGDFSQGLVGWKSAGRVSFLPSSASIGPGLAQISQGVRFGGLRIAEASIDYRLGGPDVGALLRVRCLDRRNRTVMNLTQAVDPKGGSTGIYFKTQANTASVVVSIERTAGQDSFDLKRVTFRDDDRDRKAHSPLCDLDAYMQPIWTSPTVYNETVLMVSHDGTNPGGRLLFRPDKILSVTDSTLQTTFAEGKDYVLDGQVLMAVPGSRMTMMKASDFPSGPYPWLSVAGKHVAVTYTHQDRWTGPVPTYQGDRLSQTERRLKGGKPLTIVALGDSITLGINVSGYRQEEPFMPTWAELFAGQLSRAFDDDKVKLYNTALGGMTSKWGADNARDAVASLDPDLVLIAFGMNDFWSVNPDQFRENVESTIRTVRLRRPKVEFILISSILFDPSYTREAVYVDHLKGYAKVLRKLVGSGVALLDMTEISDALYKIKGAKSLMTDPMHPDDFLARWYAQGLIALFHHFSERGAQSYRRRGGKAFS